jgi:membrane associated rhomboid family serine protease
MANYHLHVYTWGLGAIGPKKFFNLYFICGIGAIAIQMLFQAYEVHSLIGSFTWPRDLQIDDPIVLGKLQAIYGGPVVGASGAIFGVLVGFGMLYPDLELMLLFVPVPIKAKYIIPIYIVIELISGFGQFTGDNVAHFAHLGGALLGFIMIKIWRYR